MACHALDTAGTDAFPLGEACLETKDAARSINCGSAHARLDLRPGLESGGRDYFRLCQPGRGAVQRFGDAIGARKRYMELTGAKPIVDRPRLLRDGDGVH
jgi:hypothetical protein